jgi:hypothetical protein
MLFSGRINVPTAAKRCGVSVEEMKVLFVKYVKEQQQQDWELDITPCWPYA